MNTMPKDFYIDILHQLQEDICEMERRNVYISPEEAMIAFRCRSAIAMRKVHAARRHKALRWGRIGLGTAAALSLLGAAGGLSQGHLGWGAALLEMGVAAAALTFTARWRGWRA